MTPQDGTTIAGRLRVALGLREVGLKMKLAQLKRADPEASEAELRARLDAWLAEAGDEYPEPFVRIRGSGRFRRSTDA